jgi:hypothetical protein
MTEQSVTMSTSLEGSCMPLPRLRTPLMTSLAGMRCLNDIAALHARNVFAFTYDRPHSIDAPASKASVRQTM